VAVPAIGEVRAQPAEDLLLRRDVDDLDQLMDSWKRLQIYKALAYPIAIAIVILDCNS